MRTECNCCGLLGGVAYYKYVNMLAPCHYTNCKGSREENYQHFCITREKSSGAVNRNYRLCSFK